MSCLDFRHAQCHLCPGQDLWFKLLTCGFHPGQDALEAGMPVEFPEDRAVFRNVGVTPVTFPERRFQPVDGEFRFGDKGIEFAYQHAIELDVPCAREQTGIETCLGILRLTAQCQAQEPASSLRTSMQCGSSFRVPMTQ